MVSWSRFRDSNANESRSLLESIVLAAAHVIIFKYMCIIWLYVYFRAIILHICRPAQGTHPIWYRGCCNPQYSFSSFDSLIIYKWFMDRFPDRKLCLGFSPTIDPTLLRFSGSLSSSGANHGLYVMGWFNDMVINCVQYNSQWDLYFGSLLA